VLGDVVADRAVGDAFLDVANRVAEPLGIVSWILENVKGQALGALGLKNLGRFLVSRRAFRNESGAGNASPFPRFVMRLFRLPLLPWLFARMIAFGIWRVHVQNPTRDRSTA